MNSLPPLVARWISNNPAVELCLTKVLEQSSDTSERARQYLFDPSRRVDATHFLTEIVCAHIATDVGGYRWTCIFTEHDIGSVRTNSPCDETHGSTSLKELADFGLALHAYQQGSRTFVAPTWSTRIFTINDSGVVTMHESMNDEMLLSAERLRKDNPVYSKNLI